MINANQLWESGEASYAETHSSFSQVAVDVSDLHIAVEAQRGQTDDDAALERLAEALEGLDLAAADVIAGLEAPDSGQARADAISAWLLVVGAFDSLVLELAPITTSSSSSTTAPTATATSLAVTTTLTSIPTAVEAGSQTDDNGGWILLVMAVGGLAYWLGKRRGPSS